MDVTDAQTQQIQVRYEDLDGADGDTVGETLAEAFTHLDRVLTWKWASIPYVALATRIVDHVLTHGHHTLMLAGLGHLVCSHLPVIFQRLVSERHDVRALDVWGCDADDASMEPLLDHMSLLRLRDVDVGESRITDRTRERILRTTVTSYSRLTTLIITDETKTGPYDSDTVASILVTGRCTLRTLYTSYRPSTARIRDLVTVIDSGRTVIERLSVDYEMSVDGQTELERAVERNARRCCLRRIGMKSFLMHGRVSFRSFRCAPC